MDSIYKIFQDIKEFFNIRLFTLNGNDFTLWTVFVSIFFIVMLVIASGIISRLLKNKVLTRYKMDVGLREAIGKLFKYVLIFLGIIIIFSTVGVDLSAFTVLLGTLGVGIGFGLQNITANFVSGISLLIERPVKVGDRIEVGETSGDVVKIGLRATIILTNDNIAIIVPNSDFITKEVINWSYNEKDVRLRIPVGVSYASDVRLVEKLLLEVAASNADVLKAPAPAVRFTGLGDSALKFELRIWTTSLSHRPGKITSDLYFGIFETLKNNDIEIPFPQRVVHINNPGRTDKSSTD
jgi:small-conductance mechanosensitive channel